VCQQSQCAVARVLKSKPNPKSSFRSQRLQRVRLGTGTSVVPALDKDDLASF
jgi:hypothetical protein